MHHAEIEQDSPKNGFTLLEMAIVVTIIGLLVGGLVAARGYLKASQYTSMMNEAKYYINAFDQFQTTYSAIPGDMPNASDYWASIDHGGGDVHNGDGNGVIRSTATCPGTCNTNELFYSFEHLADAKLIAGHFTGTTSGGGGTVYAKSGINVPPAIITSVVYLFDHPNALDGNVSGDSFYFDGIYGNVLRIAALTTTANDLPRKPFLTPKEAYQIDSKFDDGIPSTGAVMTPNTTELANCTESSGGSPVYNNINYTLPACNLILRMQ